ncbi:MAG: tRNA pseudouridine(55) synthase TruB [Acidobacteriota bacterium]|nr:tRNA pseudouridine(55) synthase TruB [Acidobacteriota bacterium]
MDGVLVIDKPEGPTSHDIVAQVRRVLRVKRVGHTGTLDPMATGVLPLVIGRATRLTQFLLKDSKTYSATIRLGFSTDTYDALGPPVGSNGNPSLDLSHELGDQVIESALNKFRGTFDQCPPPFSAKKIGGIRAYTIARRGGPVVTVPVQVTVDQLRLLKAENSRLQVEITCSSGFYVRSLAHDIGQMLGCGAHLQALRRTRSGEFDLTHAIPLESAVQGSGEAKNMVNPAPPIVDRILPLSELLKALPSAILTSRGRRCASNGQPINQDELTHIDEVIGMATSKVRLFDETGQLVAIAEKKEGALHPRVVLV